MPYEERSMDFTSFVMHSWEQGTGDNPTDVKFQRLCRALCKNILMTALEREQ